MGDSEGPEFTGRFSRILELGRGGMARVSLAVTGGPTGFRKLLVVKRLHAKLAADEHFRTMFREEARLAARLNHPNVVQTLEVGEESNEDFIVMEYLDGQSLQSVLGTVTLPLALRVRTLSDVCEGLTHAHQLKDLSGEPLNVVHRDVSPQNVFVCYTGQVKVLDFGLAKAADSSPVYQSEGLQGKLSYMAPERARGVGVDCRADVFSVGVMLWEAVSGTRYWEGVGEASILRRLKSGDLPELPFSVESELVEVVRLATHLNPEERYPSTLVLHRELQRYLAGVQGQNTNRDLSAVVSGAFEEVRECRQNVIREKMEEFERRVSQPASVSPSEERAARQVSSRTTAPPPPVRSLEPSEQPRPSVRLAVPKPYRLTRRLFANQYLFQGLNERTSRTVLLQFFRGECDDEEIQRRFAKASRLSHPNTVRLIDAGRVEAPAGIGYLVREYVEGVTLLALQQASALEPKRVFRLVAQMLLSLADAHHQGVVHGRLGPEHILVAETSSWGEAAKVLGYWGALNPNVGVREKFLAPEVRRDGSFSVSGDLYAVGIILCQSLFGLRDAENVLPNGEGLRKNDSPLWEITGLEETLKRALANEPGERFQSAQEFLHKLCSLSWPGRDSTDVAVDMYLLGTVQNSETMHLEPIRNQLLSVRPVSIWVLDDGDVLALPEVEQAISALSSQYEIRVLGVAERKLAIQQLRQGETSPPWVVLFGALSVVVREPLLPLLASSGEISQVLVSDGEDLTLLRRCIGQTGLDMHCRLPCTPEELIAGITRVVKRVRRVSQYYDSIRQKLYDGRERVAETTREFAAQPEPLRRVAER